jgi:hypothetical protein
MAVNDMKSKVMRVCRIGDQVGNLHIMCNNTELEQTTSFEYLGTIIHQNRKIEEEVLNRVSKTNNIYYQLNQTLFGKKEINTKTKLQVYRTVMEPRLLYGSKSWPARGKEISKINDAKMKCFRQIAGKTRRDRICNERIREDLGQEGIENRLVKRQLKWYGHVVSMGEERKSKQFLEARPEGRRPRGRPRKSYEDGVEEIGRRKGKSLREMRRLAVDRGRWKEFVEAPLTL